TLHTPRTTAQEGPPGPGTGMEGAPPSTTSSASPPARRGVGSRILVAPAGEAVRTTRSPAPDRPRGQWSAVLSPPARPPSAVPPADGQWLSPAELSGQGVHSVPERGRVSGRLRCAGQVHILCPTAGPTSGGGHPLGPGCFSCARQCGARNAVRVLRR